MSLRSVLCVFIAFHLANSAVEEHRHHGPSVNFDLRHSCAGWQAGFADFAVRIFRVARYGGLGQFKCFSKNSKVPAPLIVCGPLKNSMAARSPMPSVS